MTENELDALVARTARITDGDVAELSLRAGAADLREALMSVDASPDATVAAARGSRPRRRLRTVALVVALLVAALLTGVLRGAPGDGGTAWAAPLVRFAESSPLLLLDEPGWSVTRADELDEHGGEMTFSAGRRSADLHWRSGRLEVWQRDRAHDASIVQTHDVLGAPAQVTSEGRGRFSALWRRDGRVLEFRTNAGGDLDRFLGLLRRLAPVDVDRWLGAMPDSVVQASGRADAVQGMLAGVPKPPGLDLGRLEGGRLLKDRYALGAQVTRLVACRWSKVWRAARRAGATALEADAVRAMAGARRWPILVEMEREGDWPTVIRGIAPAMRRDRTPYLRRAVAVGVTPEFCGVAFPQR